MVVGVTYICLMSNSWPIISLVKKNIALKIAFKLILSILFPIHSFTQQPTRIQLSTQKTTKSQIQKQPHLQVALSMEDARHQH